MNKEFKIRTGECFIGSATITMGDIESERAKKIRENVRDIVSNAIKSNDFWAVKGKPATARIVTNADFKRDLVYSHNGKHIKVQEACETLDALKEILRCSDWSELKMQAQITRTLADALVKLQNSTNC